MCCLGPSFISTVISLEISHRAPLEIVPGDPLKIPRKIPPKLLWQFIFLFKYSSLIWRDFLRDLPENFSRSFQIISHDFLECFLVFLWFLSLNIFSVQKFSGYSLEIPIGNPFWFYLRIHFELSWKLFLEFLVE